VIARVVKKSSTDIGTALDFSTAASGKVFVAVWGGSDNAGG
jgi:hypothetical protein